MKPKYGPAMMKSNWWQLFWIVLGGIALSSWRLDWFLGGVILGGVGWILYQICMG